MCSQLRGASRSPRPWVGSREGNHREASYPKRPSVSLGHLCSFPKLDVHDDDPRRRLMDRIK